MEPALKIESLTVTYPQGSRPPNVAANSYMDMDRRLAFELKKKINELKKSGR